MEDNNNITSETMTYLTIEKHSIPQTRTTNKTEYFVDKVDGNASSCLQVFSNMNDAETFANEYCEINDIKFLSTV